MSTFLTVAVTGLRRALLAAACWLALAGLMPAAPSAARAPADAPRVTVRALGVDHDQNIDLVVSAVPSGEVVAVWLNDGRGGFTEGNVSALPPSWSSDNTLDSEDPDDDASLSSDGPRSADDGLAVTRARAPSPEPRALPLPQDVRSDARDSSSATGPRAPPLSTLSHLA